GGRIAREWVEGAASLSRPPDPSTLAPAAQQPIKDDCRRRADAQVVVSVRARRRDSHQTVPRALVDARRKPPASTEQDDHGRAWLEQACPSGIEIDRTPRSGARRPELHVT